MQRKSVSRATAFLLALALPSLANHDDPDTNFAAPVQTSAGNEPSGVAAGDIDGDGTIDLVFADGDTGIVKVRRNDGTGIVFSTNGFTVADDDFPLDVKVADMDGDQDLDIVLGAFDGIRVVRNDGLTSNILQFTQLAPVETNGFFPAVRVAIADYDGDGKPDVVAAGDHLDVDHPNGGYVSLLRNTGGGVLVGADLAIFDALPHAVAAGDMNGDGKAEIVAAFGATRSLVLFHNPGDGTIDISAGQQASSFTFGAARNIVIADLTKDGRPDVVVGEWQYFLGDYQSQVGLYINVAGAPFTLAANSALIHSFVTTAFTTPIDAGCAVGDVDGDGDVEIVALSPLEGKVKVLHFDPVPGDLEFGDIKSFACGAEPFALVLAQMNKPPVANPTLAGRDTKLDIVTVNRAGNQGQVLLNTTPGGVVDPGGSLDPATGLTVKTGKKSKFTFTATQPFDGTNVVVTVQHTTTPLDGGSWQDLVPDMTRQGDSDVFKLVTTTVPAGTRYFRTVSLADGEAHVFDDEEAVGPFVVGAAGQADLLLTATIIPAGDSVARTKTYPGDALGFVLEVKNTGLGTATNVQVDARVPKGATFVIATPTDGFTKTINGKNTNLKWEIPALDAGKSKTLGFAATVDAGATKSLKFETFSVSADKPAKTQRAPSGAITLTIGAPLRLSVAPPSGQTLVGDLLRWTLVASNLGAATYGDATVVDFVPRGTSFVSASFIDTNESDIAPPVAGPGGRSNPYYDAATRRVFWYLGDLAGAENVAMRLVTRVNYDKQPGSSVINGQWQLRATPPGATGDPLDFESLVASSGEPRDVETVLSSSPPLGRPEVELGQFVVTGNPNFVHGTAGEFPSAFQGDKLTLFVNFENSGNAAAAGCVVSILVPRGTNLTAGSFKRDGSPIVPAPAPRTVGEDTIVDVDVGTLAEGQIGVIDYETTIKPTGTAGAPPLGSLISQRARLRSSSLTNDVSPTPHSLDIYVARLAELFVETETDRTAVPVGGEQLFTYTVRNVGTLRADGVVGTFSMDPNQSLVGATLNGVNHTPVEVAPEKGRPKGVRDFEFQLGNIPSGGQGSFTARVKLEKTGGLTNGIVNRVAVRGAAFAGKKRAPATFTADEVTTVVDPNRARLFVAVSAPVFSLDGDDNGRGDDVEFVVLYGNTSDVAATNVSVSASLASGTEIAADGISNGGVQGKGKLADTVTWNLGTVAAHSAGAVTLRLSLDANFPVGASLVENAIITATNAPARVSGSTSTTYRGSGFYYFLNSIGRVFNAIGAALQGQNVALDEELARFDTTSKNLACGGADLITVRNGCTVVCLGNGAALVMGKGGLIEARAGASFLAGSDAAAYRYATGADDAIDLFGINCSGVATAGDAVRRVGELLDCSEASVLVGGGLNLVNETGTGYVPGTVLNAPPVLVRAGLAGTVELGAAYVLGPGGGHLLPPGAGNQLGGPAVATGRGRATNVTGGSVSSTGGGQVVSDAGAGVVGGNGASIVTDNGAGVVGGNGASVIGQNGATLVGNDGGTLVGNDGGTLVAAGGLN